jgi:antitoxin YokJ
VSVATLVERAAGSDRCDVHPSAGLPAVASGLRFPPDLEEFYGLCGGVDLYLDSDYGISLVGPGDFQPSNVVIVGEQFPDDISSSWYTVARTPDREYLSIDLSPSRNGRCYDSFHEVHGIVGSSAVVARTFTELFERLLAAEGRHWYWLSPEFVSFGDAYE